MTLTEIKEWLKTFDLFEHYYIGKIVGAERKTLGIYARTSGAKPPHALGDDSTYVINSIKLLIHWNEDQQETQTASLNLFNSLTNLVGVSVGENYIYYVDLDCQEPIDVGMDTNNIYEYVINLQIYSKRR